MKKKILLLCDFSLNSWHAIVYTAKVFAELPCDFFLLNIYPAEHLGMKGSYLLDPERTFNKITKSRSLEGLGRVLSMATFELENPK